MEAELDLVAKQSVSVTDVRRLLVTVLAVVESDRDQVSGILWDALRLIHPGTLIIAMPCLTTI